MKRFEYNNNIKTFSPNKKSNPNFFGNNQELFINHKSNLEIILYNIKSTQISLLSTKNKLNIKKLLLSLKKNLNYISYNQNLKLNFYQKEINNKKNNIRNILFDENDKKNCAKIQNLLSDIDVLKIENFKIEQKIEEINNVINKKNNDYNYTKLCLPYNYFDEKENFVNFSENQKFFPLIIKLLNNKITSSQKKYRKILFAKQEQNDELESISNNLAEIKLDLKKIKGKEPYNEDCFNYNNNTRYNTNYRSSGQKYLDDDKNDQLILIVKNINDNNSFNSSESDSSNDSNESVSEFDYHDKENKFGWK